MFSAFTWGQFWTVIILLVVLYYAIVAVMYYREEIAGLFSRKADAPTPAKPARPGNSPSLVKVSSAFNKPVAASATTDTTTDEVHEQQNQDENEQDENEDEDMGTSPGVAPADVVHGSLPDTQSAGLAISETGELAPALSPAELDMRQGKPELDEVDETRKAKLRAAMAEWDAEKAESLTENPNQTEPVIENSSSIVTFEEQNVTFIQFEEEPRYAEMVADEQQLIEVDEGIPAQLVLDLIYQPKDVVLDIELPQLQGTSLAQHLEMEQGNLNQQFNAELDDLFGAELS